MHAVHERVRSVAEALGHPEWAALPDHGERVQRLQSDVPPTLWHRVQHAVTTKYQELENRYGRPMAVAIVSAGIVGTAVPLPGTSILAAAPLIGLAELHIRIVAADENGEGVLSKVKLAESEIRKLGEGWIQDLVKLVEQKEVDH